MLRDRLGRRRLVQMGRHVFDCPADSLLVMILDKDLRFRFQTVEQPPNGLTASIGAFRAAHLGDEAFPCLFNAGRLDGQIPNVTADWQWHGVWPVTTPVAMSGAWQLPDENRTVLLMVNVGDEAIATHLELDAAEYGISSDRVRVVVVRSDGEGESFAVPHSFRRDVTLPPRSALAWELTPSESI